MRFFNQETIDRVPYDVIQKAVEQAYLMQSAQKFFMPDRIHVPQKENTLLLMPCFGDAYMATKLVTVFPKAPESGFPVVNGMVILADTHTGQPLAILDGAALTARRTGAVGGLATACLSPDSVHTAGVIGAGVQGRSQAAFLLFNRQIDTLWVWDVNPVAADKMTLEIQAAWPKVTCRVAKSARDLMTRSQVVIAATTSTKPVFDAGVSEILGKTFISIGSFTPQMKEFPDAVIKGADAVYVDTLFATEESGDICQPLENKVVSREKILAFASVVQQPVDPSGGTVFFKSVGMALFDLTVAAAVLEWGIQENQGQTLSM
ncbi:ornithine cyclodeaminase family protein [Desulfotignum balticum]|jgi:ornithine cyclodeaminase/alanine dehydrogenase-like protein (mu-crystallin family)|uniref:ornithine cyclodeaminase family protein n=1 Tax=Desulfotignum balticum TaxID=115781 RepID=UPI000400DD69|nr:ornithine cyclodeaminase family protein [Desulfotignum balticum]